MRFARVSLVGVVQQQAACISDAARGKAEKCGVNGDLSDVEYVRFLDAAFVALLCSCQMYLGIFDGTHFKVAWRLHDMMDIKLTVKTTEGKYTHNNGTRREGIMRCTARIQKQDFSSL